MGERPRIYEINGREVSYSEWHIVRDFIRTDPTSRRFENPTISQAEITEALPRDRNHNGIIDYLDVGPSNRIKFWRAIPVLYHLGFDDLGYASSDAELNVERGSPGLELPDGCMMTRLRDSMLIVYYDLEAETLVYEEILDSDPRSLLRPLSAFSYQQYLGMNLLFRD